MLRYYDLYQRLQLQLHVLLMMRATDTRNMYSIFAVNKYLHTVASYQYRVTMHGTMNIKFTNFTVKTQNFNLFGSYPVDTDLAKGRSVI